jgi:hypothetical protein
MLRLVRLSVRSHVGACLVAVLGCCEEIQDRVGNIAWWLERKAAAHGRYASELTRPNHGVLLKVSHCTLRGFRGIECTKRFHV